MVMVEKDKVHVSILQFADNTLLFCKYDEAMLESSSKLVGSLDDAPNKR